MSSGLNWHSLDISPSIDGKWSLMDKLRETATGTRTRLVWLAAWISFAAFPANWDDNNNSLNDEFYWNKSVAVKPWLWIGQTEINTDFLPAKNSPDTSSAIPVSAQLAVSNLAASSVLSWFNESTSSLSLSLFSAISSDSYKTELDSILESSSPDIKSLLSLKISEINSNSNHNSFLLLWLLDADFKNINRFYDFLEKNRFLEAYNPATWGKTLLDYIVESKGNNFRQNFSWGSFSYSTLPDYSVNSSETVDTTSVVFDILWISDTSVFSDLGISEQDFLDQYINMSNQESYDLAQTILEKVVYWSDISPETWRSEDTQFRYKERLAELYKQWEYDITLLSNSLVKYLKFALTKTDLNKKELKKWVIQIFSYYVVTAKEGYENNSYSTEDYLIWVERKPYLVASDLSYLAKSSNYSNLDNNLAQNPDNIDRKSLQKMALSLWFNQNISSFSELLESNWYSDLVWKRLDFVVSKLNEKWEKTFASILEEYMNSPAVFGAYVVSDIQNRRAINTELSSSLNIDIENIESIETFDQDAIDMLRSLYIINNDDDGLFDDKLAQILPIYLYFSWVNPLEKSSENHTTSFSWAVFLSKTFSINVSLSSIANLDEDVFSIWEAYLSQDEISKYSHLKWFEPLNFLMLWVFSSLEKNQITPEIISQVFELAQKKYELSNLMENPALLDSIVYNPSNSIALQNANLWLISSFAPSDWDEINNRIMLWSGENNRSWNEALLSEFFSLVSEISRLNESLSSDNSMLSKYLRDAHLDSYIKAKTKLYSTYSADSGYYNDRKNEFISKILEKTFGLKWGLTYKDLSPSLSYSSKISPLYDQEIATTVNPDAPFAFSRVEDNSDVRNSRVLPQWAYISSNEVPWWISYLNHISEGNKGYTFQMVSSIYESQELSPKAYLLEKDQYNTYSSHLYWFFLYVNEAFNDVCLSTSGKEQNTLLQNPSSNWFVSLESINMSLINALKDAYNSWNVSELEIWEWDKKIKLWKLFEKYISWQNFDVTLWVEDCDKPSGLAWDSSQISFTTNYSDIARRYSTEAWLFAQDYSKIPFTDIDEVTKMYQSSSSSTQSVEEEYEQKVFYYKHFNYIFYSLLVEFGYNNFIPAEARNKGQYYSSWKSSFESTFNYNRPVTSISMDSSIDSNAVLNYEKSNFTPQNQYEASYNLNISYNIGPSDDFEENLDFSAQLRKNIVESIKYFAKNNPSAFSNMISSTIFSKNTYFLEKYWNSIDYDTLVSQWALKDDYFLFLVNSYWADKASEDILTIEEFASEISDVYEKNPNLVKSLNTKLWDDSLANIIYALSR